MLRRINPRLLYKYLILRFVRPPSTPPAPRPALAAQHKAKESLVKRLRTPYPISSNMLISVDGNISSGKSSLVSKLVEHFSQLDTCYHQNGVNGLNGQEGQESQNGHGPAKGMFELEVIPEPLDKWCNLRGFNLLELFYKEPKKHNFVFQHYVQLTRLMDTIKTSVNSTQHNLPKIRIMERSLQNNRYCFLELARKNEQLQSAEFAVLNEWYSWLETNMDLQLDLVIYLRTSPEVAYQRMQNRGRAEESTCPLSYLVALHESYEDWLIRGKILPDDSKHQNVIVIDANQTREKVVTDCIEQLSKFFYSKKINSMNGTRKAEEEAPKCVDICRE